VRFLSSKIFNLLFITLSCIILLPSCSSDDNDVSQNQKFRERFSGTVWESSDFELYIKFSEDKLFFYSDGGSECYYYPEGSTDSIYDSDRCFYDEVRTVIIEEDREKLNYREIWSGTQDEPTYTCEEKDFNVEFKELNSNTINLTLSDENNSEIFALRKSNYSFLSNTCLDGLSNDKLPW